MFTVCLACSFTIDGSVNGLDSALKEKADQALLGVDDTIMRLNSGECRITGETRKARVIQDDITIAFDYSKNLYRFSNGSLKKALLTPDHFYEVLLPDDYHASVRRSSASDYKATSLHCHVIDVQDIFRYIPVGPNKPFDYQESDFHNNNREIEKIEYEELPSGLIKVVTSNPLGDENQTIREYYIDPKKGYTVTHWELKIVGTIPYYERQVRDISWRKINKTWVPTAYNLKAYVAEKETDIPRTTVDWKIEWIKVNEKIDPALFDVDELLSELKYGVTLITTELGPEEVDLGWIEPDASRKERQTQREKLSWFRIIFLSVGIVFIVGGLYRKFIISKRAKQSMAPEDGSAPWGNAGGSKK